MKIAKPSEKDIDAACELSRIISDIGSTFNSPDEPCESESLETPYKELKSLTKKAPGFNGRVIMGMTCVIMYDENKIIDPGANTLELHPEIVAALEFYRERKNG